MAIRYPGTRNHMTDIPVITLIIDMPIAAAIATERLYFITFPGIAPALTSSICFSSTATAGSAEIMNQPRSIDSGMSRYFILPSASFAPSTAPSEEKPTLTPVKNSTSPTYV